ncbi:family 1 glycosylhydrolase [Paenibacillus sp. NRS-1781]|uniref:family 1 glycosylhydrolase n=1 Tax=unclassified Paenibacillus TaxID=185978 RepID=UPI003D2DF201
MTIFQFPQDFMWGTATAAYQIEGAYEEDGEVCSSGIPLPIRLARCSTEITGLVSTMRS